MIEKESIPGHWRLENLGSICKTTSGGTPSRKVPDYYNGNIPWVKSGELDNGLILDTEERITESAVRNSSAKVFPKGTLLIALYGATIGKISFLGINAATNQAVCGIFEDPKLNHKYLFYFLTLSKPTLVQQSIGGAQPNISQSILKKLKIPVPPLTEQGQIVEKIEELFSELDAGRRQLETVKAQLKTYRLAVLKWAYEGKLTNQKVIQGILPEAWKWVKIQDIASDIQYGYTETASKKNVGPKFLRITDIQGNKVDWDTVPYCKISKDEFDKKKLEDGDLVFARTGATVGKSYLIKGNIPESVFASYLIRIRFPKFISDKYVWYFFQSNHYWQQIFRGQVGTGQPNVNGKKLGELNLPLPPYREQQKIVTAIESRFLDCDKLIEIIEANLQHSEVLKQLILKQAFEGKLVKSHTS
jgi:type I restriction enzyme S subunit